jgi:hypothetical protein
MPKKKAGTLPFDPLTATDEQIRLQIARENLARYGSVYAPPTPPTKVRRADPEAKPRGPQAARKLDPYWFTVEKKCPHCEKTKNVGRAFGVVNRRGVEGPAGWCRECRSTTNYRAQPRKAKKPVTD